MQYFNLGGGNSIRIATGTAAPTVDPDAQAFITAAAITDPTQQSAVNQLVVDLKGYGVWTKMKAIYPFVGGTASQHKFNLKDPRDLDAAFRMVFNGGWTHNLSGITGNGVNTTANTKLVNNVHLTATSGSFGFYLRNTQIANVYDFSPSNQFGIALYINTRYYMYGGLTSVGGDPSPAFYGLSRVGGTHKGYRNGIVNITSTSAATLRPEEFSFATNLRNYAFGYIGEGLTDTEASNFYTAVQTFQTTLGRSIGTQTVSDADAQAFVTNAGIVDQVEANAINNLVIGMKADGIWNKMKAIYPFVGGTASTHKFNLKNPLDTDAAFRLVFYGGWTHSSTGATPNGTNAYADMFFNPTLVSTANSASLGYYSRSSSTSTVNNYVIGASDNTGFWALILRNSLKLLRITNVSTAFEDAQNTTALSTSGFYIGSQDISNIKLFRNSVNIAQNSATDARTLLNNKLYLAASRNFAGVTENFSSAQSAFAFVGDYLTDTEATNLNTRVTTFQTVLNRQIP